MRPRPPLRKRTPWASIVAVAGTALVVLIAVVVSTTRKDEPEPVRPTVAAPAPTPTAAPAPPKSLDADVALDRARAEAARWNEDAVLAGFEAGPFVAGQLLLEGKLVAEFGRPAGAHVGPGAGLHQEMLVVTVSASGVQSSTKRDRGGVGLADPNCIVQDVWRKLPPEVTGSGEQLTLRYELSRRDGRAVFRVLKEGANTPLRTLDGTNCSFLAR